MPELDALTVADLLDELGDRLELTGEPPFKVRAYRSASELLRQLRVPLADLVAQRRLKEMPGIGEALAEKITSLHKKGSHPTLERLREEVPDGVLDLMRLPGLGPKKVQLLREQMGISNLDALEEAARKGKLAAAKGIGAKLEAKLLAALPFVREAASRMRLPQADAAVEAALAEVRMLPGVLDAWPAGDVRRRCETAGELNIAVCMPDPASAPEKTGPGGRVKVSAFKPEARATGLLFATGSAAHLAALTAHANTKGMTLTAAGLSKDGKPLPAESEADLYRALELAYIEPELREGRGEVALAAFNKLPDLVQTGMIRGILHSHTTYSDGGNTLEQMAEAVRALGLEYFGVCDHSQSAAYAGGLKEDRVKTQHEEIERLNQKYEKEGVKFRIFKGIESDIKSDGALDYPEEILARFDFIVASVHSGFELSEAEQTARVVKAVSNPRTTILGHPTGRLLLRRPGFALDLEKVIAACAKHGVVVEINAHPVRLDLDWRWHAKALETGAMLSINPDSHHQGELPDYRYGVDMARKGGVPGARVLNTKTCAELAAYFEARRKKAT